MNTVQWQKYRNLFPHLKDQIYLNHAAISPMNTRTDQALRNFCDMRLRDDVEFWPGARDAKTAFIEKIGKLINASPRYIALVPSTSAGLNILALGLDWKSGDRILLNDFEFPSNVIPFTNLQRRGVEIDFVRHKEGVIDIEDIRKAIRPETRLLSISFVEFMNGFRNDLKGISSICRDHNIIFCVDAIQGVGALRMDVMEMGIDFLSSGGHKWLMWPSGVGFIFVAPRIFDKVYPAQAGWMSLETPFDFFNYSQPFADSAQRFEPGGINTMGLMCATATLDMMLEIGPARIEEKILSNTDFLVNQLQDQGCRIFSDIRPARRSGIVTFIHDQPEKLFEYLSECRISVSLREGKIRISPHFYNNHDDILKLMSAIKEFSGRVNN